MEKIRCKIDTGSERAPYRVQESFQNKASFLAWDLSEKSKPRKERWKVPAFSGLVFGLEIGRKVPVNNTTLPSSTSSTTVSSSTTLRETDDLISSSLSRLFLKPRTVPSRFHRLLVAWLCEGSCVNLAGPNGIVERLLELIIFSFLVFRQ